MLTRMARMLTHMLTRMTRWFTGSHIIHTPPNNSVEVTWEGIQHLAMPPLVSLWKDIWDTILPTQCNKLCNIVRNLNSTAISQNVTLKMMDLLSKQVQKFHTYNASLPKLGYLFWLVENLLQPIRGITQIWEVLHHQYGVSVLISQTSFRRGNHRWHHKMLTVFSG